MNTQENLQDGPQRDRLTVFGNVTAGVTHELNNVLSVIDQAAGLLEDLLAMLASGGTIDPDRLRTVHGRILRQVERGVAIVQRLNRFSHSVDEPIQEFDARIEIEDIACLARRNAEMKRVRLETSVPETEIRMKTDPFAVQHAVYRCIQTGLGAMVEGGGLVVEAREDGDNLLVSIGGAMEETEEGGSFRVENLLPLLEPVHGQAAPGWTGGGDPAIVLRIPRILPCDA